jgi:hypothetical protein
MFWRPSKELQACTRSEKIGTGTYIISYLVFQPNLAKYCWHLCLLELRSLYVHVVQNITQCCLSERRVSPRVVSVKGEFHHALAQWKESLSPRWLCSDSHPALTPCRIFGFFYVLYSTLLHLPPLRFQCVRGCWTQCRLSTHVGFAQTLTPRWLLTDSHPTLTQLKQSPSPARDAMCFKICTFTKVSFLAQQVILAKIINSRPDQCFERSNKLHPRFIVL